MHKNQGKKLYSLAEVFVIFVKGIRMIPYMRKDRDNLILSEQLREQVMLAVTQVNGCAMCTYAHTEMALESGMSLDEISAMLAGEHHNVEDQDLPAILFAQHYADTRGKPTAEAWGRIVNLYGEMKALLILSYTRMIMIGNAYGIPFGSLTSRFRKKENTFVDKRSNLLYELAIIITMPFYLVLAILVALIAGIFRVKII